jgi:hypothetical protein
MCTTAAPVAAVLGWPRSFKSLPTNSFPETMLRERAFQGEEAGMLCSCDDEKGKRMRCGGERAAMDCGSRPLQSGDRVSGA